MSGLVMDVAVRGERTESVELDSLAAVEERFGRDSVVYRSAEVWLRYNPWGRVRAWVVAPPAVPAEAS